MRNTLTAERIAEMQAAEITITERLGYTLEEQSAMMYESGIEFLQEYFKTIPVMGKMMEGERMFWQWWKNEWFLRNVVFMEDTELPQCGLPLQRLAYAALHDGKALTSILQPARIVYVRVLPTLKSAV